MNKPPNLPAAQAGSIMLMACGMILAALAMAFVVFDAGRLFIVRSELQNAADAAALAGAGCLARQSLAGSEIECAVERDESINWQRAESRARDQLGKNTVDQLAISTTDAGHAIEVGYWNLSQNTATGGAALSTATGALQPYDIPALKVTVIKGDGVNGGMVALLSAALFGSTPVALSASAVALLAAPGKAPANSLPPYVINRCLLSSYWDSSTGQPGLATSATLNGVSQTIGEPWEFRLGPDAIYADSDPDCTSGQWTGFDQETSDATVIQGLIENGNPEPVAVGDQAWIEPGVSATLYDHLAQKYLGSDLPLLVVDSADSNLAGWAPVTGIAGFHITQVSSSERYIQGYFIRNYILSGASGAGPDYYGVYTPPRLAQ